MVAVHDLGHKVPLRPATVHLKTECGQPFDPITHIQSFAVLAELPKDLCCLPATVTCLAEVGINNEIMDRLPSVQSPPPQQRLEYPQDRLVEPLGNDLSLIHI